MVAAFTVKDDAVTALPAEFVTVIRPVTAPDGITIPSDVADMLCRGKAIEPPFTSGILTCGAEPKLLPVIVTIVPTVPDGGVKLVIAGPV